MLLSTLEKLLKQYHLEKGLGRKWLPTFVWGDRPDIVLLESFVSVMRSKYTDRDVDISFLYFYRYLQKPSYASENKTYLLYATLRVTNYSDLRTLSLSEQKIFFPWCNELPPSEKNQIAAEAARIYDKKYPPEPRSEFVGLMGGI